MEFDQLAARAATDISDLEDLYSETIDLSGDVPASCYGIHLSFSTKADMARVARVVKLFNPPVIYAGRKENVAKLRAQGYPGELQPWYEDGGFALLFRYPLAMPAER